jgi:lactate permease
MKIMTWTQNFTPIAGSLGLSALVALIPTLYFFWALTIKRMKGVYAGLSTLLISIIVAVFAYQMPTSMAVMSAA